MMVAIRFMKYVFPGRRPLATCADAASQAVFEAKSRLLRGPPPTTDERAALHRIIFGESEAVRAALLIDGLLAGFLGRVARTAAMTMKRGRLYAVARGAKAIVRRAALNRAAVLDGDAALRGIWLPTEPA